jgi:hypothetical protein
MGSRLAADLSGAPSSWRWIARTLRSASSASGSSSGTARTDQEGAGQIIAIVRGSVACPLAALKAWLEAADITSGPIFRAVKKGGAVAGRLSAQSIAHIVKIYAEPVGLDPAQFAGHSMRAGFLTSAAKRGASIFKMMVPPFRRDAAESPPVPRSGFVLSLRRGRSPTLATADEVISSWRISRRPIASGLACRLPQRPTARVV